MRVRYCARQALGAVRVSNLARIPPPGDLSDKGVLVLRMVIRLSFLRLFVLSDS